ncbi:MAG: carboxylating nicotinate-nucleotide diphosphorylase [Bacteroidetes bacterium]|nr:carboxylating nicotinate-nucleotide diphosphorylase [Bacteroidota bacterium]
MESQFQELLAHFIENALREDIGDGDHTTLSCIPSDAKGRAVLKIKQRGVLAGVEAAKAIFRHREPGCIVEQKITDGTVVQFGEIAFEVEASIHTILQCERVVLNTMQRMSGIATLTRQYVEKVKGYPVKLLDTRKTTPGFRLLEKEAVRIGGGFNHRFALYDQILIKDNHIDYCGGINQALDSAYRYVQNIKPGLKIEIETRNLSEVEQVLKNGKADRIMLDNFIPDDLKIAVSMIQKRCETEASGGINLDNIVDYAATGVDFISVGALIHQAKGIDLSLKASFL